MDLPTLFFMTTFSIFIYYFAKLTMQVEQFKSSSRYFGLTDNEHMGSSHIDEKR